MMHPLAPRPLGRTRGTATACALTLLLGFGCAHPRQAGSAPAHPTAAHKQSAGPARDAFRQQVPAAEPGTALHLPTPTRTTLSNGLTLYTVSKRELPLVHVVALIRSGAAQDPPGSEGLAALTAEVARRGTASRDAHAIAQQVEDLGSSLSVSVDDDTTSLSAGALTQNIGPVLDVLADVLQGPSFAGAELERARAEQLSALLQHEAEPSAAARAVFRRVVFGAHPYGHTELGRPKSVRRLQRNALVNFHRRHWRPANAAVIVVGDITAEAAAEAIEQRLGRWHGATGVQAAPAAAKAQPAEIALVDRPGAAQSQLRVGMLGIERDDPDFDALRLGNAVLGGMFGSRLIMNLREDKGWTYGVYSSVAALRAPGSLAIGGGIRTDATAPAITEILREVERMRDADIGEDELLAAKNHATLSLPGKFESVGGIAGMVAELATYDLPPSYYQDLPARLAAISASDVRRALRAHLDPERLSIVVVGDRSAVGPGLEGLGRGPVHLRDAEGAPIAAGHKAH